MGAVWYRFRAELGSKWRGMVLVAVLAGIAGAAAITAVAGARRTDNAYARLVAATKAADVLVNPDFGNDSHLDPNAVARLRMVSEAGVERSVVVLPLPVRGEGDIVNTVELASRGTVGYAFARPHVLHGRMPNPDRTDEVLLNPVFARRLGVHAGERFDAAVMTTDDFRSIETSGRSFAQVAAAVRRGEIGTKLRMLVAGIGVTPEEVVVDEGFDGAELFATPALSRRYPKSDAGYFGIAARLKHGDADLAAFKEAVQALPHDGAIEFQTGAVTKAKVERAVRPQVGALTIFAVVIALTGLLLVGQALARQAFVDSIDHPTLRALGFGRRQLFVTNMVRASIVAISAALVAVVLAVIASPLTPIGVARTADPDLGVYADAAVLVLGAVAVIVAVLALAALPAWWYAHAPRSGAEADRALSTSRVVGWLRSSGTSPATTAGVRMALEPGRGTSAVPVRTTIAGSALAIGAVVAALTFAASLDHLVSTPRLYGWAWDARVETGADTSAQTVALQRKVMRAFDRSRLVAGYSTSVISRLDVDGVTVTALGVAHRRGRVGPTIVSGRAPRRRTEIALGAKTLDRIGVGVGDVVHVRPDSGGATRALKVVGRVVLPGLGTYPGSDKTALGEGALLERAELRELGPDFGPGPLLVRLAPHATRAQLAAAVSQPNDSASVEVFGLQRPSDIVSYERVRSTPLVLAAVLALLAVATVAHALVTAVRRRRRDLALLKTLGFTRRQVSAAVAWQATTFGLVALVIGVPVGVVVGRWAWTALADNLGTVAQPIVPVVALVLAVPLVVVIANAVAFVPGRIAARLRPAAVLRSE